jgi:hypothetical protein
MSNSFAFPVDVPWMPIAASPDMMATVFCEGGYPPVWQSSLAIYAYEPSASDLPAELCNQKITYLKVTCSITGFQPTAAETSSLSNYSPVPAGNNPAPVMRVSEQAFVPASPFSVTVTTAAQFVDNVSVTYSATGETLMPLPSFVAPQKGQYTVNGGVYTFSAADAGQQVEIEFDCTSILGSDASLDFTDSYFACYGVLLNVAVFPSVTTVPQSVPGPVVTFDCSTIGSSPVVNPLKTANSALQFTVTSGGVLPTALPMSPNGSSGQLAIDVERGATLEIDLPVSTNVSLDFGSASAGTVTAYEFGTQVLAPTLLAGAAGALSALTVTKIVISSTSNDTCLNSVSYASLEGPTTLKDYPHIIDFEPKTRDLYQSATDQSEILTGSSGSVNTGKSQTNTTSTQMGLGMGTNVSATAYGVTLGGNASLTGSWGSTSSDSSTTQIDQSRQMRETQGTSTNISQQYNLLTGYHSGTNRATFIMLPRPHTLQATDYRTFVRGLRMIEGVQEFLLIVSRPTSLPGLCIEATLETGHFPENVTLQQAGAATLAPQAQTNTYPVVQAVYAPGRNVSQQASNNTAGGQPQPDTWTVNPLPTGYVLDVTKTTPPVVTAPSGMPGGWTTPPINLSLCPGVTCTITAGPGANPSEFAQALSTLTGSVTTPDGTSVQFNNIRVNSNGLQGPFSFPASECNASATLNFVINGVQQSPAATAGGSDLADDERFVVVSDFIVTSRDLCACINSCTNDNCVMLAPTEQVPYGASPGPLVSDSVGTGASGATSSSTPAGGAAAQALVARGAASRVKAAAQTKTGAGARAAAPKGAAPAATRAPARPAPAAPPASPVRSSGSSSSVVYETRIKLPRALLEPARLKMSRTPAARELMYEVKNHMMNSWRMPQRRPHNMVGFLDSDYVCARLRRRLPARYLAQPIADFADLPPALVRKLGPKTTVGQILGLDLHRLRAFTQTLAEAVRVRRILLGFKSPRASSEGSPAKSGKASDVAHEQSPKAGASHRRGKGASRAGRKRAR